MLAGKALEPRLLDALVPMMRSVQGVLCSWLIGSLHCKTTTGRFGSKFSLRGPTVFVAALPVAQANKAILQVRPIRARALRHDAARFRTCDKNVCMRWCCGGTCP